MEAWELKDELSRLAVESKNLKQQIAEAEEPSNLQTRAYHLSRQIRTLHLAYGFKRGLPYEHLEVRTRTVPQLNTVQATVAPDGSGETGLFADWLEAAMGHLKNQNLV